MQEAEEKGPVESARAYDVPETPHAQSCWSVLGTLSLIVGSSEVPRLHRAFGPHRMVTQRHTQRLVKWLEEERWIHKQQSHVPFAEAQVFKLRDERLGYGRLALAMWPLRAQIASWRRANPNAEWIDALPAIALPEDGRTPPPAVRKGLEDITKRLHMLSSGHENCPVPTSVEELVAWWQLPPP